MRRRWYFRGDALLVAMAGTLAGCGLLVGLDEVSVSSGGSGGHGTTGAGATTSEGASGGSGQTTTTTTQTTGGAGGQTTTTTTQTTGGAGGQTTTTTTQTTGGAGGQTTTSTGGQTTTTTTSTGTCAKDADCSPPLVCQVATGMCAPPVCGDGLIQGAEQCEDGGATSGDGCSAACQVEPYHQCRTRPPLLCVAEETLCDDGLDGDGDAMIDGLDPDCMLPVYMPPLGCQKVNVYRSADVPVDVPDADSKGIQSFVVVPDDVAVAHMSVVIDLVHGRDGDLSITLTPPFGQPRTLSSDNGGSGADYADTVFDNTCGVPIAQAGAPFSDCYKAESFLPQSGQPAMGVWALTVRDQAASQTGMLLGWTLVLCAQ